MKAQLLTATLMYDTYNFEQLYIKNISFIKYMVSNAYYTQNNREGRELNLFKTQNHLYFIHYS